MSKDKIEVSMNVYDIPIVVEALEKANKEIERLNNIINETIDKLNEMKISMLIDTHKGIEIDSKFVDDVFETIKFLEENKELKGSDKE